MENSRYVKRHRLDLRDDERTFEIRFKPACFGVPFCKEVRIAEASPAPLLAMFVPLDRATE